MPRIITPGIVAEFRNRLCTTASELLAEKGVEGFNMREVAKRLRVSPMTTYRYFRDKEDILSELRTAAFARLSERLQAAGTSTTSPSEAAMALARAYCAFAQAEPAHYRLMFDLFQSGPSPTPSAQEFLFRAGIHEQVALLVAMGVIDGEPDVLARAFWSALHGVAALHLTQRLSSDDIDCVLCDVVASFLRCDRSEISFFAIRMSEPSGTGAPIESDMAVAAA